MAKRKNKVRFVLNDDAHPGSKLWGSMEINRHNICLSFVGYGECCADKGHGQPVVIEFYDGKLRVHVWSDINSEDPTHAIEMDGAAERERNAFECSLCKEDIPAHAVHRDRDNDVVCDDCWDERLR